MASYRPDLAGALASAPGSLPLSGPLMTMNDWAALAQAPQLPAGTRVSVQARPVGPNSYIALPGDRVMAGPDHMFVQFDDGQNSIIARGGPTGSGLGFVTGSIDGSNRMSARVDPASQSPDYQKGYRTLAETFLPGVTASQAAAAAQQHAQGVNKGGNGYGLNTNSNSYAADVAEPIFGWRPGDDLTPGYQTHLRDDGSPPPSTLDQLPDLSPALRAPFG